MDKSSLNAYFKYSNFDVDLFTEEAVKDSDYILSKESLLPCYQSKVDDMSKSFIQENNVSKTKQWRGKNERNNAVDKNVSKNETFNFLAGDNTNKSEIANFVKGSRAVNDTSINNSVNQNLMSMTNNSVNDESQANAFNSYFINKDSENSNKNNGNFSNTNVPLMNPHYNANYFMPIPVKPLPFEPVKIENILTFNKKRNIPEQTPLWYLKLPMAQYISGPCSSKDVEIMYSRKFIDGNVEFRPVDLFVFSNQPCAHFIKFNLINSKEWVDLIEDSPMLQYTELFAKSEKILDFEVSRVEVKQEKFDPVVKKEPRSEKPVSNKDKDQTPPKPKNIPQKIEHPVISIDDTMNLTQNIPVKELQNFVHDTVIEDSKPDKTLFLDIKDQVDQGEWEVVKKGNKKNKKIDESVYLIGNKPKEKKKESKFSYKVDILSAEEMDKKLKQKAAVKSYQPDFEAFNEIGVEKKQFDKNKKMKGKPQDVNLQLGFKFA